MLARRCPPTTNRYPIWNSPWSQGIRRSTAAFPPVRRSRTPRSSPQRTVARLAPAAPARKAAAASQDRQRNPATIPGSTKRKRPRIERTRRIAAILACRYDRSSCGCAARTRASRGLTSTSK